MNFPRASPEENMSTDSSIRPTPTNRAERPSLWGEILASNDMLKMRRFLLFFVMAGLSSFEPAIRSFRARPF